VKNLIWVKQPQNRADRTMTRAYDHPRRPHKAGAESCYVS
jgi:hypothetical protein